MGSGANNDNERLPGLEKDSAPILDITGAGIRGAELFEQAVAIQKVLCETRVHLKELDDRIQSAKFSERRMVGRELRAIALRHKQASDRLRAIEDAMDPDMRLIFWNLTGG